METSMRSTHQRLVPRVHEAFSRRSVIRAFGAVLESYSDDEIAVIADYLRRASEVGRAQTARLRATGA